MLNQLLVYHAMMKPCEMLQFNAQHFTNLCFYIWEIYSSTFNQFRVQHLKYLWFNIASIYDSTFSNLWSNFANLWFNIAPINGSTLAPTVGTMFHHLVGTFIIRPKKWFNSKFFYSIWAFFRFILRYLVQWSIFSLSKCLRMSHCLRLLRFEVVESKKECVVCNHLYLHRKWVFIGIFMFHSAIILERSACSYSEISMYFLFKIL